MTAMQAHDRAHPVDRNREQHVTITRWIRDRRRPRMVARDVREPYRLDRVVTDPDSAQAAGVWEIVID